MEKTIKWTDIICRYIIGFGMTIYGLIKIFNCQFYTYHFWKDLPLNEFNGFMLAWTYNSFNPILEIIIGLIELIVGMLVFNKRTSKLGILLFVPIMANVVLINIIYQIGALFVASTFLIAGLLLTSIHLKEYINFFFPKREKKQKTNNWKTAVSQILTIGLAVGISSFMIVKIKTKKSEYKDIVGTWNIINKPSLKKVYFETENFCVIKTVNETSYFNNFNLNANDKTLTIIKDESPLLTGKNMHYSIKQDTLTIHYKGNNIIMVKVNEQKK